MEKFLSEKKIARKKHVGKTIFVRKIGNKIYQKKKKLLENVFIRKWWV